MKVALVHPAAEVAPGTARIATLPLGIAYLAAVLRTQGYVEVEVLDAVAEGYHHVELRPNGMLRYGLPTVAVLSWVRRAAADLLGVSAPTSAHLPAALEILDATASLPAPPFRILGGNPVRFLWRELLVAHRAIDAVALGEGELLLPRLVDSLAAKAALEAELPGLATRAHLSTAPPPPAPPSDLDALPFPARGLFPLELYAAIGVPNSIVATTRYSAPVITTRGCPGACRFCSSPLFMGRRLRKRSAANVALEVRQLRERFGTRELQFEDDNLTWDRAHATAVFEVLARESPLLPWCTPNGLHPDTLDEALLRLMKRSGCYHLVLAVESAVPRVQRQILNKTVDLRHCLELGQTARRLGMGFSAYFMVGIPGETMAEREATVRFASRLAPDAAFLFLANALPGTKLAEEWPAKGTGTSPVGWGVSHLPSLEAMRVEQWRARRSAYLSLYLLARLAVRHPGHFFRRLLHTMRTPAAPLALLWPKFTALLGRTIMTPRPHLNNEDGEAESVGGSRQHDLRIPEA